MTTTTLIIKQLKITFFFCTLLLLTACTTTQTAEQITVNTEKLLTQTKTSPQKNLVKDQIQSTEITLSAAKEAIKNKNNNAHLLAEKALSDIEYAKAKIATVVYKDLSQRLEQSLKHYQKLYK